MNKKEVMEALGISQRTLERYVDKGLLSVTYTKGKTNQVSVYDSEEVERLKQQLAQPKYPRKPAVINQAVAVADPAQATTTEATTAIAPLASTLVDIAPQSRKEFLYTINTLRASVQRALSIEDASLLTRLSRQYLVAAIKAGDLHAVKRGRGWHIIREDLDEYIQNLRRASRNSRS
jgi:excisionase family DNA binding protein